MAEWLVARAFGTGAVLRSAVEVSLHKHDDFRRESGDPLAFGETDVEMVSNMAQPGSDASRVAILVENKVDAKQGENQGLRYRARGNHGKRSGAWAEFRSVLVAPRRYLDSAYPLRDFQEAGWDLTVAYEEIVEQLRSDPAASEHVATMLEATAAANAWNKPIPAAVRFWKEYEAFGRANYPDVPVLVPTQIGSRAGGVWPSFYENDFRGRKRDAWRRRVQIVHIDNSTRVSLFVKRVAHADFARVVEPLLEPGIDLSAPGGSWQSVRIDVLPIDPSRPLPPQTDALHQAFQAARRLREFFAKHEDALKALPIQAARRRRN